MYLSNPHLYEARTNLISVVAVSPEESKECKVPSDVINLVTDKITLEDSLFHPQGGGQPSDKGTLVSDNNETFNVLFVSSSSKSGVKVTEHYGCFQSSTAVDADSNITASLEQINLQSLKADSSAGEKSVDIISSEIASQIVEKSGFKEGVSLKMSIDIPTRQLHTRLHSAGHTIDAALKRCDGDIFSRLKATKGYHFIDGPYVEYEGEISEKEIKELPDILNVHLKDLITENISTIVSLVEKSAATTILGVDSGDLKFYPEQIRIVEVAGLPCACGGTHVSSTIDLKTVTITKIKKKKRIVKMSYVIE